MTNSRGDNFTLPPGLSEADLLDLIEGVAVPPDRQTAVAAAVRADARLAALVRSMRSDRAAMATMDSNVRAPAGLLGFVEARLEREALAELTEPIAGSIRVSPETIERPSPLRVFFENAMMRRLAMAASLLLATGLGVWGIVSGIRNWPHAGPSGGTNIAQHPVPVDTPHNHTVPDVHGMDIATVPVVAESAALAFAAPTSPMDGPGIAADGTVFDEPALVQLAREGRLAIVVSGHGGAAERLGAQSREIRAQPIDEAALAGEFAPVSAALTREALLPREHWALGSQDPWAAMASAGVSSRGSRRVIGFWTPATDDGIAAVLAATGMIAGEGDVPALGCTARVLVLDEPVRAAPLTDPQNVLWWSSSPSRWQRGTIVPVIIEE